MVDAQALREQLEAAAAKLCVDFTQTRTEQEVLAQAADLYRRNGIPVARARMRDRDLVLEITEPRGYG